MSENEAGGPFNSSLSESVERNDKNNEENVEVETTAIFKDQTAPKSTDIWELNDEETESKDQKKNSDDEENSQAEICRICHMGGFPPVTPKRSLWEWNRRNPTQVDRQDSTQCFAYLGPLISVCQCRGTVGLVHTECLERWLTESGHTMCELCGHRFMTKRVPRYNIVRSIAVWFCTVVATQQMFLDVMYFVITTPMAIFSCYICASAIILLYDSRMKEIPWSVMAMLPTCCLTLFAYWGWLLTLSRIHGRRWRRYWRNNYVVRLIPPEDSTVESRDTT